MIVDYKKKHGIYLIKCLANGKFYVGSAKCIYTRLHVHFSLLSRKGHYNEHIQRTFDKYGTESFIWGVVEFCGLDVLIEREQHYIDTLKPHLNIAPNAQNTLGYKMPEEVLLRKSKMQKGIYPEHLRGTNNTVAARKKISDGQKMAIKNRGGLHENFIKASIKANTGRVQDQASIEKRILKQSKLNQEDVIKIDKLLTNGVYQKDIANMFSISQRLVVRVKKRLGYYQRFLKAIDEPLFQSAPKPVQAGLFTI